MVDLTLIFIYNNLFSIEFYNVNNFDKNSIDIKVNKKRIYFISY